MVWVCLKTLPRSNALDHHVPISGLKITAPPKLGRPKRQNQVMPGYFNMGVSENVVYPFLPNGFADQTIPFLNGYFIGGIPHFQTYPYGDRGAIAFSPRC